MESFVCLFVCIHGMYCASGYKEQYNVYSGRTHEIDCTHSDTNDLCYQANFNYYKLNNNNN